MQSLGFSYTITAPEFDRVLNAIFQSGANAPTLFARRFLTDIKSVFSSPSFKSNKSNKQERRENIVNKEEAIHLTFYFYI